jgi:hypothetical protein
MALHFEGNRAGRTILPPAFLPSLCACWLNTAHLHYIPYQQRQFLEPTTFRTIFHRRGIRTAKVYAWGCRGFAV